MSDDRQVEVLRVPGGAFGANAWLVEEMYEQYKVDPTSVAESWQEFFADYGRNGGQAGVSPAGYSRGNGSVGDRSTEPAGQPGLLHTGPLVPASGSGLSSGAPLGSTSPGSTSVVANPSDGTAAGALPETGAVIVATSGQDRVVPAKPVSVPLRGAAARIVSNMESSLSVPTATSFRNIPAKLLQINRTILNQHLARVSGTKVSFTHLIGFAVVKGLKATPVLNSGYVPPSSDGDAPAVVRHDRVGLGLAVDVEKSGGTRTLMVPVIRDADSFDFKGFVVAYEELVRKVHSGRVSPDDFAGATATLTNPGTLGTLQSVPRLMAGQGAIIGVGSLGFPAEFEGADRATLASMGIGPTVTISSTYDHRIIQGAESGLFLSYVAQCLIGEHGFYDDVFHAFDIPLLPVRWQEDTNAEQPSTLGMAKQVHVQSLINMYRVRGHLIADLDPLAAEPPPLHPELDPATYGLSLWDLEREWLVDGLAGCHSLSLGSALDVLRDAYCRTLGIEYMHIQDPEQKRWIQEHVEGVPLGLLAAEQRHVLDRLNAAEAFERFLHTRYVGQKRFGLEGAESTIVLLDAVLEEAADQGLDESVIGMSHRGRLNVLANIVGKSYGEIFREFEGDLDPESVQGSGDVKYHKGAHGIFTGRHGKSIPVALASNPSHLEAVDPVVEGMTRAKQDRLGPTSEFSVLSVLLHGDAAFAGQGVVAETLELSQLAGYRTGGTIHVVVNNQLGFTTLPESARSSVYSTDVAKSVQAPIFHVNGDDPEACVRAGRLAFAFRQAFHKDVVIDLVCYRRHGHNEGDDPSYTQPRMYAIIENTRSVRKLFTETLIRRGDLTIEEAESALEDFQRRLQTALEETRQSSPPKPTALVEHSAPEESYPPDTGVDLDVLRELTSAVVRVPAGFTVHPKLVRQFDHRAQMVLTGEVDWALGEALSIGSLVLDGTVVRVAGQDTRRGTFSQRHAVLVDYVTGEEWVPLAHLGATTEAEGRNLEGSELGSLDIHDSLLSEYAALGFEYGYSVESPEALVVWEAQFGDFANGAQIIIDNFLVSAEDKWGQRSGLVLLLPHGYEGQGPEHSSGRIERFLTLCARNNIRVAQPTSASQYFHLLRRQVMAGRRVPLVVFTPKSLLRARQSRSPLTELSQGYFRPVLDDPAFAPKASDVTGDDAYDRRSVTQVVLCSGKVAFEAMARRDALKPEADVLSGAPGSGADEGGVRDRSAGQPCDPQQVAVVRLEQLYPWPEHELLDVLSLYPNGRDLVWLQEEPENMGAWSFVHARLHKLAREQYSLRHVSRAESASPANGSAALHHLENEDLYQRLYKRLSG